MFGMKKIYQAIAEIIIEFKFKRKFQIPVCYSKIPCVGLPWQGTVMLSHMSDFEKLFPLQVLD